VTHSASRHRRLTNIRGHLEVASLAQSQVRWSTVRETVGGGEVESGQTNRITAV
jgi:hypothetical protein